MAGLAQGIDVSNFAGEFNWAGTSGLSFGICAFAAGLGDAGAMLNAAERAMADARAPGQDHIGVFHAARTAATRSAGMPTLRACSRMLSSSGAR